MTNSPLAESPMSNFLFFIWNVAQSSKPNLTNGLGGGGGQVKVGTVNI